MEQNSKKTGTSTNGHIEYTRNVKNIKCKCKSCYHSQKAAGTIYCKYYDKFSPNKKSCARYSPKENYRKRNDNKTSSQNKQKTPKPSIMSTYVPTFPWEMP